MNKAKATVSNFLSGHHDTTVDKQAAPAVVHETVRPVQHEEVNKAVNKEVHQDHYHHLVQPVKGTEVLPEQHIQRTANVEHREFDHRNHHAAERAVRAEAGKLQNQREVAPTTYSQSQAPVVQGEQTHHHVHEVIQPLIQKEVVQPQVVHTTVPVHEVHHKDARHHGTTTLPEVSMDEFNKQHGVGSGVGSSSGRSGGVTTTVVTTAPAGSVVRRGSESSSSSDVDAHGIRIRRKKKAGLLDRLNPKTDADGDGKKGFLD